jgi:hypothetical protein
MQAAHLSFLRIAKRRAVSRIVTSNVQTRPVDIIANNMGTRGLFGFRYRGRYYIVYNHFDSYPSYLGRRLAREVSDALRNGKLEWWKKVLAEGHLKIISEQDIDEPETPQPTPDDIERLEFYTLRDAERKTAPDWCRLLRKCQGSFNRVMDSGYLLDHGFQIDPLWHEHSYVLDLDEDVFHHYKGRQLKQSWPLAQVQPSIFDGEE